MPDEVLSDADVARRAIALIDLTDLADDTDEAAARALCERAARHGTAAVCVWPDFVGASRDALDGTGVRVATVVNFPTGDERAHAVGVITERAVADGADEIDVVLPYRAWLAGNEARASSVLRVVRELSSGRTVKVILETGSLPDGDAVGRAARFAIEHGADFVKTSTGKTERSATLDAAGAMLREIAAAGRAVGLKPSGGIRTVDDARGYLALADEVMGPSWASPSTFRFGASGLLDALLRAVDGDPSAPDVASTY